ncbi:hypothetical protein PA598K_01325 [Paenibacillus sp. 598K]|uniref:hypothetical protein n=1 Tax=Paenibacillus sp. 598K TaxID=1117987 RepID=UPI000FFA281E|nr:hypothetical protein [Paenibacillus sp. 598K]GBF73040.1 hypothetical protein PA598K_01325 [Paenibacillus sp. 598K]
MNTRQKAAERLTQVQAQLYALSVEKQALEDEAKTLAGYLNLAAQEDKEQQEQQESEQTA